MTRDPQPRVAEHAATGEELDRESGLGELRALTKQYEAPGAVIGSPYGQVVNDPFHQLPDEVTVSLDELRGAISDLEDLLEELHPAASPRTGPADILDRVIGRMTRWIWPLLDELDSEEGYDE